MNFSGRYYNINMAAVVHFMIITRYYGNREGHPNRLWDKFCKVLNYDGPATGLITIRIINLLREFNLLNFQFFVP